MLHLIYLNKAILLCQLDLEYKVNDGNCVDKLLSLQTCNSHCKCNKTFPGKCCSLKYCKQIGILIQSDVMNV